jgi:hypothetical protein
MAELVEVPVEGSDGFLIETDRRLVKVARHEAPPIAEETLQKSLDRVNAIADIVQAKLASSPRRPQTVKVEFGVKLTGEANVMITKAGGEAHFVVTLEWKGEAPEK